MLGNIEDQLVKKYQCWSLLIHPNQGYLGRMVIWCSRPDAQDLSEATLLEQQELFIVLNEAKTALRKAFQPDWYNYSFLGNETPHLHGHIVPRYAQPRPFANMIFTDALFGRNYITDKNFNTPKEVSLAIREKLQNCLP